MSVFIEGPAIHLNRINENGWGILSSAAGPIVESLKSAVIRVCARDLPHGCDITEDPYSEIGRIFGAYIKGDWIYAQGEITDPVAAEKITSGVWEKNWSVFGYEFGNIEGWSQGYLPRSMTLVRFPAWEGAGFKVVAAAAGFNAPAPTLNSFKISSKQKCSCKTVRDVTMGNEPLVTGETPEQKAARLEAENTALKSELSTAKATLQTTTTELNTATASIAEKDKTIKDQAAAIAEHEKYKAASISLEKHRELLVESNKNAVSAAKAEDEKKALFAEYAGLMKEMNIEVKEEDFKHLSAADIKKSIETTKQIIQTASNGRITYAAGGSGGSGSRNRVGSWSQSKKAWG